jgi:hypothetical protein
VLTSYEKGLIDHVKKSIDNAENGISKLNPRILSLEGMSSSKIRHFLNNICSMPNTSYLEIGVWKGSTFISSLYQNSTSIKQAIAIDNWSEFSGPKNEFTKNCHKFLADTPFKFYSVDSFNNNVLNNLKNPINVYFYDGNHDVFAHELAFTFYDKFLDDVFIAIVDDWNWDQVKRGTKNAFENLKYQVLYESQRFSKGNGDKVNWWNGFYIAVVRKTK